MALLYDVVVLCSTFLITTDQAREIFSQNFFWKKLLPVWQSGFWESYISTSVRVTILKQKPTDAHFSSLKIIKFLKQSIEPREHKIYPISNKLTFMSPLIIHFVFCEKIIILWAESISNKINFMSLLIISFFFCMTSLSRNKVFVCLLLYILNHGS